eukprot:4400717-Heterocapsa_arctica.AAC.1
MADGVSGRLDSRGLSPHATATGSRQTGRRTWGLFGDPSRSGSRRTRRRPQRRFGDPGCSGS